jgi:hypothetical protein
MPLSIVELLGGYDTKLKKARELTPNLLTGLKEDALKPVDVKAPVSPGVVDKEYEYLMSQRKPEEKTYTAQEARDMGVDIEDDWTLDVKADGVDIVTPEGWRVTDKGYYVSPEGTTYSRMAIEQHLTDDDLAGIQGLVPQPAAFPVTAQNFVNSAFPGLSVSAVTNLAEIEPEKFIETVRQRGRSIESDQFLRTIYPSITENEINMLFGSEPVATGRAYQAFDTILSDVFPNLKPEVMSDMAGKNPDTFVQEVVKRGWNAETESLIRAVKPAITDDELSSLFGGNAEYRDRTQAQYIAETNWDDVKQWGWTKNFTAGLGDALSSTSGVFSMMGMDDQAEWSSKWAMNLQAGGTPDTTGEFDFGDLLNPDWWSTKVARSLPIPMLFAAASIPGIVAGGAVAAGMGLGRVGTWILGSLGSTALSRPLESAMEAGESYNQAIMSGKSEAEAKEAFNKVFRENMLLQGYDAAQIALALAPTPKWVPASLVKSGLVRTIKAGGKMAIVGLSEGGEELYQEMVQRQARGETMKWDAISKEVFVMGAFMGMGMGLGGDIISPIVNKAQSKMKPDVKAQFNARVNELKAQNITEAQAKLQALGELVETSEEVKGIVKRTVDFAKRFHKEEAGFANLPGEEPDINEMQQELAEQEAELAGLQEEFQSDPAAKYVDVINKFGEYKGEIHNLRPDQYRQLTGAKWVVEKGEINGKTVTRKVLKGGSNPTPEMMDKTGKYVRWEYALDAIATEAGFKSGEEFKYAIEHALETKQSIERLKGDIEYAKSEIPQAAEGEPEAGLQSGMFGERKVVRPQGKGQVTQISMEDQLKLQAAKESVKEKPPEAKPVLPVNIVAKITKLVKDAKPARKATEQLKHEELKKRVAVAAGTLESGRGTGQAAFGRSKGALKGSLPEADYEIDLEAAGVTQADIDELFNMINRKPNLRYFQKLNTASALEKVFYGQIPTEGELKLLEDMFGPELVNALLSKRTTGQKALAVATDILNIPRTLQTMGDLSATLRQGILLFGGQPVEFSKAFASQLKVIFSAQNAKNIEAALRSLPHAGIAEDSGLYQAPLTQVSAQVGSREEAFMGRLIERVPGIGAIVRASERTYVTFLNVLRATTFEHYAQSWEGTGKSIADYKKLADFINHATGRGDLGRMASASPILNAIFFSPRYIASRLQVPLDLINTTPAVRKVVARNLIAFVAEGMAVIGLCALAGADTEDDPRSSDFGKIKFGNTRYDFWGGYLPYVRLVAQLSTGKRKSTSTGDVYDVQRKDFIDTFFRSKLAPIPGLLWDLAAGSTFIGEELNAENAPKILAEKLTPMFIQDITDALADDGNPLKALFSILGVGVQTYSDNWNTNLSKLGLPSDVGGLSVPVIYNTKDFYGDTTPMIGEATADMLKNKKNVPAQVVAVAEAKDIKRILDDMRGQALTELLGLDADRVGTYEQLYAQWKQRQTITDPGELADFDKDNPNAYRANMTQREYALLREYDNLSPDARKQFLKDHPELSAKPREDWLKAHPEENAKLAIWGQAKVYTQSAYDAAQKLIVELDIPDKALDGIIPPKELAKSMFDYQDIVSKTSSSSAEAQLFRLENPAWDTYGQEAYGWKPVETPIEHLRETVQFRPNDLEYTAYGDKESDKYIADDMARAKARADYLETNPEYAVKRIRDTGYALGLKDETVKDKWVEYNQLPDTGFRKERYRLDNPDFDSEIEAAQMASGQSLWVDVDPEKVPDVAYDDIYDKYQKLFEEYDNVTGTETQRKAKREIILGRNPEFALDRQRREAYGKFVPEDQVDTYAKWYTTDFPAGYEDDWFLMENKSFYDYMIKMEYWEPRDFSKVPTREVGALYEKYKLAAEGSARMEFRLANPALDKWLVDVMGYKPATQPKTKAEWPAATKEQPTTEEERDRERLLNALGG